jgi:hypothetical protein
MEELEYTGEWWIPNNRENRKAGILRFSRDNGLRLKLIGMLDPPGGDDVLPVVLGWVGEVGEITLVRCFHTKLRQGQSDYVVDAAFIGSYLDTPESRRFASIDAQYSHLFDWVGISGISRVLRSDPDTHSIVYQKPDRTDFGFTPVGLKTPIRAVFSFGASSKTEGHVSYFAQSCGVRFHADDSWTLSEWKQRVLLPFRDFLTFATRTPNAIREVSVPIPDRQGLGLDDDGRRIRLVKVVFQSDFRVDSEQPPRAPDLILPYAMIRDRAGDVLSSWTALYATIDPVIGLFMNHYERRNGVQSVPADFINLVQAVESFHGRHLSSGGRPSLKTRLTALIEKAELAKNNLVSDEDKDSFTQKIVDTRNYYTHYSREYEGKVLTPPAMLDAITVLETLLEVLLLCALGFSTKDAHVMTRSAERAGSLGRWRVIEREP